MTKAEGWTQPIPSESLLVAWAGVTGTPLDKLTALDALDKIRNRGKAS